MTEPTSTVEFFSETTREEKSSPPPEIANWN